MQYMLTHFECMSISGVALLLFSYASLFLESKSGRMTFVFIRDGSLRMKSLEYNADFKMQKKSRGEKGN